eukprot:403375811
MEESQERKSVERERYRSKERKSKFDDQENAKILNALSSDFPRLSQICHDAKNDVSQKRLEQSRKHKSRDYQADIQSQIKSQMYKIKRNIMSSIDKDNKFKRRDSRGKKSFKGVQSKNRARSYYLGHRDRHQSSYSSSRSRSRSRSYEKIRHERFDSRKYQKSFHVKSFKFNKDRKSRDFSNYFEEKLKDRLRNSSPIKPNNKFYKRDGFQEYNRGGRSRSRNRTFENQKIRIPEQAQAHTYSQRIQQEESKMKNDKQMNEEPKPLQIEISDKRFQIQPSQENTLAKKQFFEAPRLQVTPIEKTGSVSKFQIPGLIQTYITTQPEGQRFKAKIYLPRNTGINYVGLLIGPKGIYQKKLEEQTGCKILIRGRGSHKEGHPMQNNDQEDQHVLVIGETEDRTQNAAQVIQRVISADEETRNAIRLEQCFAANEMQKDLYVHNIDDYLLTPYGPPTPQALIIPVPNECVGLIIGKGGETIRYLQMKSGSKIQVAKKEIPNSTMRYVFIEGNQEKFDGAKKLIENIVDEHRIMQEQFSSQGEINRFPGPYSFFPIPDTLIDIIIGQHGQTIKLLHQKTGCYIFIPDEVTEKNERILQLSGSIDSVDKCKIELSQILENVKNYADTTGQTLNFQMQKSSFLQQNDIPKPDLLEQAIKQKQILFPKQNNFNESEVKDEPNINEAINQKVSQQFLLVNQKDFLFDHIAAAYYERFTKFVQGQPLNFDELPWPALHESRMEKFPQKYKTYFEEYTEKYGQVANKAKQVIETDFNASSETTNASINSTNTIIQSQNQKKVYQSQVREPQIYNNPNSNIYPETMQNPQCQTMMSQSQQVSFTQSQNCYLSQPMLNYSNQFSLPNWASMQQQQIQQPYSQHYPIYNNQPQSQIYLSQDHSTQYYQMPPNNGQQKQSAVSLFYQCFGPDGALTNKLYQQNNSYLTNQFHLESQNDDSDLIMQDQQQEQFEQASEGDFEGLIICNEDEDELITHDKIELNIGTQ